MKSLSSNSSSLYKPLHFFTFYLYNTKHRRLIQYLKVESITKCTVSFLANVTKLIYLGMEWLNTMCSTGWKAMIHVSTHKQGLQRLDPSLLGDFILCYPKSRLRPFVTIFHKYWQTLSHLVSLWTSERFCGFQINIKAQWNSHGHNGNASEILPQLQHTFTYFFFITNSKKY